MVVGSECDARDAFPEDKLANFPLEKIALSSIVIDVSDDCQSATVKMGSPNELWAFLKKKYEIREDETIGSL